jgi:hypothetical protein
MSRPEFTAEASLYTRHRGYAGTSERSSSGNGQVLPQIDLGCAIACMCCAALIPGDEVPGVIIADAYCCKVCIDCLQR